MTQHHPSHLSIKRRGPAKTEPGKPPKLPRNIWLRPLDLPPMKPIHPRAVAIRRELSDRQS